MPKLLINFKEILSCSYGNFEGKNKLFEPPIKYCLNIIHIKIHDKCRIEEWDKKCFNQLGLLLLRIWREICKTFCPMSCLYGFLLRHYHCTKCTHARLTNLKNFCTLWLWFSLDVFFMDSCSNRVNWETLTYLERYHLKFFSFKEWTTYQSYGAHPENKNRGC